MTAYTTIPDSDIEPDKPIKSATAFALRDNLLAVVEGDPTAPSVQPAILLIGGKGGDGALNNAATVTGIGYFEFASMSVSSPKTLPVCSVIRIAGNATLSSVLTVASLSRTVATHDQERIEIADFMGGFSGNNGALPSGAGTIAGGGGSVGRGGTNGTGTAGAGGAGKSPSAMNRPWVTRRPFVGGNGGQTSGGDAGREWGPGGGCLILIIEGDFDCTGGEINVDGGHTNDLGGGSNQPGGGGGGMLLLICTGTVTGGTFRARGGNANEGGAGQGGAGGGGWVQLVATAYAGTQTGVVTAGTTSGAMATAAADGLYNKLTLTRDQIRTLLQRL